MNTIIISNQKVEFTHRRLARSRSVRLSIRAGGKLTITTPLFFSQNKVEKFLTQQSSWILDKLKFYQEKSAVSIFPHTHKDYLINKSKALKLVRENLAKLNAVYGFKYSKITIRNQSSRWGSCSKDGNLNFNYKMIYLSQEISEYIVAHELCHLKEMNHGRNFWQLVAKTVPHWKILRKQLKNIS
ncbi:MAG: hypothetical protein ACD_72C00100G0002 [uncultured bacterium]|nr:MAG: hypothetical protein ACD_72C00100G0002 [uncultured bacterium]